MGRCNCRSARFLCASCQESRCPTCSAQQLASLPSLGARAASVTKAFYVYLGFEALLANLVKPYRVVSALVQALGGQAAVTQSNVGLWWGLWIGGNLLANVSSRMTVNADGSISDAAGLVSVLSAAVSIAGAFACIHVIRTVQAHVPRWLACLSPNPP